MKITYNDMIDRLAVAVANSVGDENYMENGNLNWYRENVEPVFWDIVNFERERCADTITHHIEQAAKSILEPGSHT